MTPTLSWLFVAVFVGGPTLLLWSLMRIAGKCSREEEELARTLVYKHCKKCAHEYDYKVVDGRQAELGKTHVVETTCFACEYESGRMLEIDISETSIDEIRAIGRENKLAVGEN